MKMNTWHEPCAREWVFSAPNLYAYAIVRQEGGIPSTSQLPRPAQNTHAAK